MRWMCCSSFHSHLQASLLLLHSPSPCQPLALLPTSYSPITCSASPSPDTNVMHEVPFLSLSLCSACQFSSHWCLELHTMVNFIQHLNLFEATLASFNLDYKGLDSNINLSRGLCMSVLMPVSFPFSLLYINSPPWSISLFSLLRHLLWGMVSLSNRLRQSGHLNKAQDYQSTEEDSSCSSALKPFWKHFPH